MTHRSTNEGMEEVKQEMEKSQEGVSSWEDHFCGHLGLSPPEVPLRNHLGIISLWLEEVGSLSTDLQPPFCLHPVCTGAREHV